MRLNLSTADLNSFNWQALLRPQMVARATLALKVLLSLCSILLLALAARAIWESRIASSLEAVSTNPTATSSGTEATSGRRNYSLIVERDIFSMRRPDKPVSTQTQEEITPLPVQLIGTYGTHAIIEHTKDKIQDVFNIGDSLFGEAKVTAIFPQKVELDRNGKKEVLLLTDEEILPEIGEEGVAAISENRFIVDEKELDKSLENLPLLLSQARAVPYFKDGKSVGLRLFAIKPGSMFDKIGLKNGDILKEVNGKSLADPSQALKLFEELKDQRSLTVRLERNREEKEFQYEIR